MKFISWNTNGLRACVGKGFLDAFTALDADFFCLHGQGSAGQNRAGKNTAVDCFATRL